MKKLENFSHSLDILKSADFEKSYEDEIYRTGIIGQFNLTFALAWKALQEVLRLHGSEELPQDLQEKFFKLPIKPGF